MTERTESPSRGARRSPGAVRIGLIVVLVILLLMLAALGYAIFKIVLPSGSAGDVDTDAVAGLQWVRSIYAYGPSEAQRMDSPVAVAISEDGTIYGVDTQTNMVMAFNPDGSVRGAVNLIEASGSDASHLGPKSIMIADNGDVYVGANAGQAVYVFTEGLDFIRSFALDAIPFAIAQDDENLLISTNEGILRFTIDGEFVGPVAIRGLGDGEVNLAQAIVMSDEGVLYVADSMSGRVQALGEDGNALWTTAFGAVLTDDVRPSTDSTETSGFQVPTGIAVDANGRLVVSDMQMMQLFVLDPIDGSIVATYGEHGFSDGQFTYPMGIAYDSQRDWFALADMGNSRIQVLRIPESAPPSLAAAVRRSIIGPVWICCLPPLLLFLLLAVALMRRRRTEEDLAESETAASVDV